MIEKKRSEEIRKAMRKENAIFLALITLFGAAVLVEYCMGVGGFIFWWTVAMIIFIAALGILRNLMVPHWVENWTKYVQDERMKKIDLYARAGSWIVTFLLTVTIALLAGFEIFDVGTYFSVIFISLVMGYSWMAFKWYYGRKGDVE